MLARRGHEAPRGREAAGEHDGRGVTAVTELADTGTTLTGNELLQVEGLEKHFPVTRGIIFQKQVASVKAVDGITFGVSEGETLGVVGESGCGKSTMARCIM